MSQTPQGSRVLQFLCSQTAAQASPVTILVCNALCRLAVRRDNDPFVNKFVRRHAKNTVTSCADIEGAQPADRDKVSHPGQEAPQACCVLGTACSNTAVLLDARACNTASPPCLA
jgi:hypothetical protein